MKSTVHSQHKMIDQEMFKHVRIFVHLNRKFDGNFLCQLLC